MSAISKTFLYAVLAAFWSAVIGPYHTTDYATNPVPTCAAVSAAQLATVRPSLSSAC